MEKKSQAFKRHNKTELNIPEKYARIEIEEMLLDVLKEEKSTNTTNQNSDDDEEGETSYLELEIVSPREKMIDQNDLKIKLKRWAVLSGIPIPKINSLLTMLRDFNNNLPYDAKTLLGHKEYLKMQQKIEQTNISEVPSNLNGTNSRKLEGQLNQTMENVKKYISINFNNLQNFLTTQLSKNQEETHTPEIDQSKSDLVAYFPLKTPADFDFLERKINDGPFRLNLVNFLRKQFEEHGFYESFKKTFSDDFLNNYVLRGKQGQKGLVHYDIYSKVLFEAWRTPNVGLEEFTKQFGKAMKRSMDRRYLRVTKKKPQNTVEVIEVEESQNQC